jgi:hypothetical protein
MAVCIHGRRQLAGWCFEEDEEEEEEEAASAQQ